MALVVNTRTGHVYIFPLPRETWKEDSLEPGPKDLPAGSDPLVAPRGMIEDPSSEQVIEYSSDTPSSSTGEVAHHLGRSHQVSHSNSAQNTTEVNLYTPTLAYPRGNEHNVPS